MESTALQVFQKHTQQTVQPTGLWLHHTGVLGASPDGLIPELNAIVEVKCPYSVRDKTIAEACKTKNFCLCTDEHGTVSIRDGHPYIDQIQGQMHISKTDKCFFVVYTTKECCIVEVGKDEKWEININNLVQFYVDHMLPHMVGSAQPEQLNQSK